MAQRNHARFLELDDTRAAIRARPIKLRKVDTCYKATIPSWRWIANTRAINSAEPRRWLSHRALPPLAFPASRDRLTLRLANTNGENILLNVLSHVAAPCYPRLPGWTPNRGPSSPVGDDRANICARNFPSARRRRRRRGNLENSGPIAPRLGHGLAIITAEISSRGNEYSGRLAPRDRRDRRTPAGGVIRDR